MDPKLIALKLLLDELGVDSVIDTVDDRKRVQKAIYLGQLSGVDLGYRFSWYLMGPYCPALTQDYYALADEIESGHRDYQGKELKPQLRARLDKAKGLFEIPIEVDLNLEDWLELLASYHYLRVISGKSDQEAKALLQERKPHVSRYADQARGHLMNSQMILAST